MPDNGFVSDEDGMAAAVAAFAKDEVPAPVPQPAPTPPPQVPDPDEPEKVPVTEPPEDEEDFNKHAAEKTEPEKLEEEFVEFTGKQKERFNSVYGALKRLERENADYQRKLQQYQQPQPLSTQYSAPSTPALAEPKPLLANFETADQWADAVSDWSARKAEAAAVSRLNVERVRQNEESSVRQYNDYINGKISEGQKKFGQREFNEAAKDIVEFAPHGSVMYNTLFDLDRFPEVVVHLAKNLELADKISSLRPLDQAYELKALERKLALAAKSPPKLPTKVEAPGNGDEPAKPNATLNKLRAAAKASGNVKDFAAIFQADPTL